MRSLSRAVVIGALAMPLAFAGAGLASADDSQNSSKPGSGHEQNWNGGQNDQGWGQNHGWNGDQGWNGHGHGHGDGQNCRAAKCGGHKHKPSWNWDWNWVSISDDDTNVINAGIIGGNNNFFSGNQID